MRWALFAMLACGFTLGLFARPLIESIRVSLAERAHEKAQRRQRMQRAALLTDAENRAFEQIQRGYKKTAKEDR